MDQSFVPATSDATFPPLATPAITMRWGWDRQGGDLVCFAFLKITIKVMASHLRSEEKYF